MDEWTVYRLTGPALRSGLPTRRGHLSDRADALPECHLPEQRGQRPRVPGRARERHRPRIIVIQEWWGLDSHIADVCNRFARAGFVALAPDLFGGRVAHNEDEAMTLAGQLSPAQAVTELSGAVDYLLAQPSVTGDAVGVVGFCMGGAFVLHLAARAGETVGAAVVFYGTFQGGEDFSGIRAPVQGHFGEHDQFIPPGRAREVMEMVRAQAGVPVEVHFYDAGHAFFNDQNHLGSYNEDLARLAWDRPDFLRSHLAASLSADVPAPGVGKLAGRARQDGSLARLGCRAARPVLAAQ